MLMMFKTKDKTQNLTLYAQLFAKYNQIEIKCHLKFELVVTFN